LTPLALALLGGFGSGACDPNVVIGAKWNHALGGGAGDVGGMPSTGAGGAGGNAGSSSDAGTSLGGSVEAGAAGTPTDAGAGGDSGLIFSADHEIGSLAQWDEGPDEDSGGYYSDPDNSSATWSKDVAHSGQGSAKLYVNTTPGDRIARLYRRIENGEAYYSAWFYLEESHTPSSWWSIFLFRAVRDRTKSIDLWSVELLPNSSDKSKLTLSLYDHQYNNGAGRNLTDPSQPLIPIKQWFQIQAYLQQAQGQPSKLTIWLDGNQVFEQDSTTPAPTGQPLYWVIGNGGGKMTPAESTVYVDDAEVSTAFVQP
jgi:hypothetical protein